MIMLGSKLLCSNCKCNSCRRLNFPNKGNNYVKRDSGHRFPNATDSFAYTPVCYKVLPCLPSRSALSFYLLSVSVSSFPSLTLFLPHSLPLGPWPCQTHLALSTASSLPIRSPIWKLKTSISMSLSVSLPLYFPLSLFLCLPSSFAYKHSSVCHKHCLLLNINVARCA